MAKEKENTGAAASNEGKLKALQAAMSKTHAAGKLLPLGKRR